MTAIGDLVGRLVDLGIDVREATNIIDEAVMLGQSRPSARKKKAETKAPNATRVPPAFYPTEADIQCGIGEGLSRDRILRQVPQFIDFWSGVAGAKGLKQNWNATFRNRLRQVADFTGATPPQAKQHCATDPRTFTPEQWASILRRYEMTGNWNGAYGSPPGSPGYLGPRQSALL